MASASCDMNTECNGKTVRPRALFFALLFVLLFQAFARYAAAPTTGLVLDDWNNWQQADSFASLREAYVTSLCHPDRPVTFLATTLGYRFLGDQVKAHAWLSVAAYSLVLTLAFFLIYALTRSLYQSTLWGLLFAVLPNLTGHYHWPTLTIAAGACALPLYLGSALAWVLYVRRGGMVFLVLSVLGYGLGLFGYEIGAFLPLAYAVLLTNRTWRTRIFVLLPFGAVMGLYAAWRMSNAFGMGYSWYGSPAQMQVNLSWVNTLWSVREIAGWWLGGNVWSAFVGGINGFTLVGLGAQRWIVWGNLALLSAAGLLLWRMGRVHSSQSSQINPLPVSAFACAWIATTYAPCLIAYTASRLNFLPAVGVLLLVVQVLVRLPISKWGAVFLLWAFLCMLSVQGTARNWRESAILQRNLFDQISREKAHWKERKIVLFDTRRLAQRLTPGITGEAAHDISTVSHYNNAGLLRGFAPSAMLRRLADQGACPLALLDVEHGARIEGNQLIWHERYDPSRPHTNALADVYVFDCLAIGAGGP